ncbi:head GIN domain-containing protein [Faecalibacter sp. LW9]|uniref:head GIN domain-containing protein n=1 Tax=Faecalibacter sp. LW9 TaxID=3103144 RepID=UPI002AFE84B6|nr:head GIN domain-containing protein [Faecalibacter sp. LW9]
MKNIFFTAIALIGTQFSFAQLTKNVGDYNSLKVYDRIPVELIQSNSNKVEVSGDLEKEVDVVNKNGDLKIKMNSLNLMQGSKVKVKVYYKNLYDIQASQGSMIYSDDKMKSSILKLSSNEGSSIKLDIDTKKVNAKINSGAELILNGDADALTVNANSGGKFYGKTLNTENASLTTNMGGIIEAKVKESVDAKTRAGGTIDIYGSPKVKNNKTIAGGKINFRD